MTDKGVCLNFNDIYSLFDTVEDIRIKAEDSKQKTYRVVLSQRKSGLFSPFTYDNFYVITSIT